MKYSLTLLLPLILIACGKPLGLADGAYKPVAGQASCTTPDPTGLMGTNEVGIKGAILFQAGAGSQTFKLNPTGATNTSVTGTILDPDSGVVVGLFSFSNTAELTVTVKNADCVRKFE